MNSVSSVPGGGWACLHDQIKNEMASSCREMGQEVAVEVHNLFSHLIPQGPGRVAWREQSSRTRWGLVPDFAMRIRLGGDAVNFYLLELKCIHLSASWYGPGAGCQREEARGKSCVPVEKRAKSVAADHFLRQRSRAHAAPEAVSSASASPTVLAHLHFLAHFACVPTEASLSYTGPGCPARTRPTDYWGH